MGSWPRLLCCLFLWCSSVLAVAQAKTHHHKLKISYQFKFPDCVRKLVVTINYQTPGTTIRATQGGTVVVTNSLLTENFAIHWHGIRQARYRSEHHVLHDDRWNRSTYEQAATGLASVPLVWIGQIPGPTIRTVQGPAAAVTLKNSSLTEHVAIHWHGIREISTPLADGTEGVMQCPPLPGDTFMVDRPGTYQAHNGVQRSVELNGTFAVSEPARDTAVPFAYNREHSDVHLARCDMQRTAGLSNMQRTMVVVSLPERAEAEALVRDGGTPASSTTGGM